jgi:hypothetical protein
MGPAVSVPPLPRGSCSDKHRPDRGHLRRMPSTERSKQYQPAQGSEPTKSWIRSRASARFSREFA